jgi:hypothetical protein
MGSQRDNKPGSSAAAAATGQQCGTELDVRALRTRTDVASTAQGTDNDELGLLQKATG